MEFRLLGAVQVATSTGTVPVPGGQRRTLLARLLVDAGRPVDLDDVVAALWPRRPPPTFRHAVHARVHELRRFLAGLDEGSGVSVAGAGAGYRLDLGTATTDVDGFRSAVRAGRRQLAQGAAVAAEQQLRAGLDRWRAEPLSDVAALRDSAYARALADERAAALRDWAWAALVTGRHEAVVTRLAPPAADPLSEAFAALRMVALARAGRRSDALAEYRRIAHALDRELQVAPAPWFARLRDAVDANSADVLPRLGAAVRPAATRPPAAAAEPRAADSGGSAAQLVGRGHELRSLREALDRVSQRGQPQLLTVVGEAGIGKTRLLAAFATAADAVPRWYSVTCRDGDRSDPLRPLAAVLRAAAGVADRAPDAEVVDRLAAACPYDARPLLPVLHRVIGVDPPGPARPVDRTVLADAWCRFVFPAGAGPAVLVVDDLHEASDAVLDVVERLPEVAEDRAVLVVAGARPELLARRPGWCGGRADTATVTVPPLGEQDSRALLRDLLGPGADDAGIDLGLAGGNPLFLEELARARAGGIDPGPAQASITGMVLATLDAAEPGDRAVLRSAAVLRAGLTAEAVAAVSGQPGEVVRPALHRLRTLRFLRRVSDAGAHPPGAAAYGFRHDLLREAVRGQLGPAELRAAHLRGARWHDALAGPDGAAARAAAGSAAHHFTQALDARPAGAVPGWWPDAARAVLAATEGSAWLLFPEEALRWLRAVAGSWSPELPARDGAAVHLRLGERLIAVGQDGRPAVDRARSLYRESGAEFEAARAELALAWFDHYHGRRTGILERLEPAIVVLRAAPDRPGLSKLLRMRASILEGEGRMAEAVADAAESVAAAARGDDPYELAMCRLLSAALRSIVGRPGALHELEALVPVLDELGEHRVLQRVNVVETCLWAGDLARARTVRDGLDDLVAREPSALARGYAHLHDLRLRFWEGRWTRPGQQPDVDDVPASTVWQRRLLHAEAHLLAREWAEAATAAQEALAAAGDQDTGVRRVAALACRAAAARGAGSPDATALAEEVAATWTGVVPYLAAAHVAAALAAAGWTAGALDAAPPTPWRAAARAVLDGDLAAAARRYEEIGSRPDARVCRAAG